MKPFESFLAPKLDEFIAYRLSLGYAKRGIRSALLSFDHYLKEQQPQQMVLPPSFFLALREKITKTPRTVNRILSILRSFFQFLVRQGVYCENPLQDIPPLPERYFVPYVFCPEQIERLLQAVCKRIRPTEEHFLLDVALYLSIVLLARCGLRISEPLRLLRTQYRSDEATLYIEKTKFKKDRLIPVPYVAKSEIENYLALRDTLLSDDRNPFLLAAAHHKALRDDQVRLRFHQAIRDTGLYRPKQTIGDMTFGSPSPHSLRHSFAINTLKRIKERGGSPQHALPVLAAYMGHRKYQYTGAYLKVSDAHHRAGLIEFARTQLDTR
jgi:site-specific recombinase XerD